MGGRRHRRRPGRDATRRDAQILAWQDMAGLTSGHLPQFVKQYGSPRADLLTAARWYVSEVASGRYPGQSLSPLRRCVREALVKQQFGDGIRGLVHCVVAGWEVVDLPFWIGT